LSPSCSCSCSCSCSKSHRASPQPFGTAALLALALSAAALGCASTERAPEPAPRLLLHGGRVWTGAPRRPLAEAVLVEGEIIAAVGRDRELLELAGPGARRIDLRGRLVVPGFIDSHVHFLAGGDELLAPDLRGAASEEDLARRLGEAAARLPAGSWLTAGSWDHESWPGARLPARATADRHTPRHPVFVSRLDGHMALANSLALEIAGVGRDTPDPSGGAIVRDPGTGEPTGILKDAAMDLVARHVPPWSRAERLERARAALRHAASLGVTGVCDMGTSAADLEVLTELHEAGELTARVWAYPPIADRGRLNDLASRIPVLSWVQVQGVKAFADGSLGSSTALLFEDYLDAPGNRGLALADLAPGGALERSVEEALADRLTPAVHGIGDRAVRLLLDLFERVETKTGKPWKRLRRLEHAQHIHPDDLERFGRLEVVASVQPYHAIDDGRWAETRIGAARARTSYAFRSLLDRGAILAFGSDWPVAPLSPIEGIYAGVWRRTLDGEHPEGWVPEERITVEEALRAYTLGSARAAGIDRLFGTIAPEHLADLVVLDRDILERGIDPDVLRAARVDLTLAGGKVVYERAAAE
jgi:hypothetical protein